MNRYSQMNAMKQNIFAFLRKARVGKTANELQSALNANGLMLTDALMQMEHAGVIDSYIRHGKLRYKIGSET